MKITELFSLGVDQMQVDFVDVNIDHDYPLYIDPYLISTRTDPWSVNVDRTIKSFFSAVASNVRAGNNPRAIELFMFMSEPKETCLGISSTGTTNGRGVGEGNATEIIEEIIRSRAIEMGVVQNIEDVIVFVDDVDKDKLSDMTTNIIRKHLIDYTKEQCEMWGIPLQRKESLPYWDSQIEDWNSTWEEILIYNGRELLLVPKAIVSPISEYNAQKYGWHFVVTNERNEQLARRSSLVKLKKYKNGKEKYYLPKSDVDRYISSKVLSGEFESKKDYLRDYTQKRPELFERFRSTRAGLVSSLTNNDIASFSGAVDVTSIVDALVVSLRSIPQGTSNASEYHHFIKCILEMLFYPRLNNPTIEERIHDGRKRIDIVMSNIATKGFFYSLHNVHKIPSGYIFIECKNYTHDVGNPEIDQLSGRFAFNKGKFGLLMCRNVEDKPLLYKRCSDTYGDDRGLMIPLDDNDVILMLESLKTDTDVTDELLSRLTKSIILGS